MLEVIKLVFIKICSGLIKDKHVACFSKVIVMMHCPVFAETSWFNVNLLLVSSAIHKLICLWHFLFASVSPVSLYCYFKFITRHFNTNKAINYCSSQLYFPSLPNFCGLLLKTGIGSRIFTPPAGLAHAAVHEAGCSVCCLFDPGILHYASFILSTFRQLSCFSFQLQTKLTLTIFSMLARRSVNSENMKAQFMSTGFREDF